MNRLKKIAFALLPIFLLIFLIDQVSKIPSELKRPIPAHRVSLKELEQVVKSVELAAKVSFDDVDSTFESSASTPFGKMRKRVKRGPSLPKYERTELTLQGILQGESTLAVLIDPNGKTHIVKRGDTVLNRKITKISESGVILRDRIGSETLSVE